MVGVSLPLSGPDRADAPAIWAGARYALSQRGGKAAGVAVELRQVDEEPGGRRDPGAAVSALAPLVADPSVLGVVGPYLSATAALEVTEASPSRLPLVSPSVTGFSSAPGLFRMLPSRSSEALALAALARRDVAAGKLAVGWSANPSDAALANGFAAELARRGGAAAPREQVDPRASSSVDPFLRTGLSDGATSVFVAAPAAAGACLLRPAMNAVGFAAGSELLGGDELVDGSCAHDAPGGGVVAVRPGPDADHPGADVAGLRAFAGGDFGRYSLPAFQATKLLLDAVGRALRAAGGNLPGRSEVRSQLASSFAADGGPRVRLFSVYALTAGSWSWRESLSV